VAQDRLRWTADGQVRLALRRPWADGTTAVVFDPVDFLARLAVLVARPRVNLILYHGVLAPRAGWRRLIVPERVTPPESVQVADGDRDGRMSGDRTCTDRGWRWAALMQRTFGFDVLACARCGGRLRLIALIEQATVIQRILRHLGLPAEVAAPRPARAPPHPFWADA
jgi:hypothetical protein